MRKTILALVLLLFVGDLVTSASALSVRSLGEDGSALMKVDVGLPALAR